MGITYYGLKHPLAQTARLLRIRNLTDGRGEAEARCLIIIMQRFMLHLILETVFGIR